MAKKKKNTPEQAQETVKKQYIMMVDEISMAFFGRVCPSIQFLEVVGMNMAENDTHQLLANPINKLEPVKPTAEV